MAKKTRQFTIPAVNARLELSGCGLVLELRGKYISLRGTLPPKPGSGRTKAWTQRISLKLRDSPAGIMQAESFALVVQSELDKGSFDWGQWIKSKRPVDSDPAKKWIEAYKAHLMASPPYQRCSYAERKFKNEQWHCGLSGLRQSDPVSLENCLYSLNRSPQKKAPGSRARQLTAQNLTRFAKFCGLDVDLREEGRGYSLADVERYIPTEEEVIECWDLIPKRSPWRSFYALSAVYGLRPHEVFSGSLEYYDMGPDAAPLLCFYVQDVDNLDIVRTKTGGRMVVPLPESWIDIFGLTPETMEALPKVDPSYSSYGTIASSKYLKYGIPFTPYGTRHRWSIYGNTTGELGTLTVSKFLGHAPRTNERTYQKHMDEKRAIGRYMEKRR